MATTNRESLRLAIAQSIKTLKIGLMDEPWLDKRVGSDTYGKSFTNVAYNGQSEAQFTEITIGDKTIAVKTNQELMTALLVEADLLEPRLITKSSFVSEGKDITLILNSVTDNLLKCSIESKHSLRLVDVMVVDATNSRPRITVVGASDIKTTLAL